MRFQKNVGYTIRAYGLPLMLFFFSGSAFGQFPPVETVDLFGLRKVSEAAVRAALPFRKGDDAMGVFNASEQVRQKLKTIRGVQDASVSVVCCDDKNGKSMVFVGIQEVGHPALRFREAPTGSAKLPDELVNAGKAFQTAFTNSLSGKDFSEDDSQGHALFGNPAVREVQLRFPALAAKYLDTLRKVLRESSNPNHRAFAAQLLAYHPDKKAILPDLAYAMSDPFEATRNEAMRALLVIARYSRMHPELKLKVPTVEFVKMLNSLVWTDRNKSAGALDIITMDRDPKLLAEIRKQAVDSLAEMARWTNPGHAAASFKILGRVAGMTEAEIDKAWAEPGKRDENVRLMLERLPKYRKKSPNAL